MQVRFTERQFGFEFTTYERQRQQEMYKALRNKDTELFGYVTWLNRRKSFLIVPTLSSPRPYAFCEISDWMPDLELPPNNAFISARGKWVHRSPRAFDTLGITASSVFVVENYRKIKPDAALFKPDISYKEYRGLLFEPLQNVEHALQDLVAHSLVSSPKTLDRLGGLTVSYFNEAKGTAKLLLGQVRRCIPRELATQQGISIPVDEIGRNVKIEPFPWLYKQFDVDTGLGDKTVKLLKRPDEMPFEEITISLRSENAAPKSLNEPAATMSDVPIVASNGIEKRREFYDPSTEVFKYMLTTHMLPITLSTDAYNRALQYSSERIALIAESHPAFANELGKGGILDLNLHGKPLTLLHIGLSHSRSNVVSELNDEVMREAFDIFEENIGTTLDIWQEAHPGDGNKFDYYALSPEQRRIMGFIIKNGPSSPQQVFEAFKREMSRDEFLRIWEDIYQNKRAVYEKDVGIFDIVPSLRKS